MAEEIGHVVLSNLAMQPSESKEVNARIKNELNPAHEDADRLSPRDGSVSGKGEQPRPPRTVFRQIVGNPFPCEWDAGPDEPRYVQPAEDEFEDQGAKRFFTQVQLLVLKRSPDLKHLMQIRPRIEETQHGIGRRCVVLVLDAAPDSESAQLVRYGAENAETGQAPAKGKKARAGKGASKRAGASPEVADQVKPPVRLPPLLLYGPPGVGKTHFCESLAKVLGVPVRRHPMDQAETSGALLGSDAVWGNSRYGLVFDLLGLGEYANPLVILDELDKAQVMGKSSGGLSSPTGVLHSLLEPVSAAQVRDISLDLELDASQIAWIATANYPWWVPATLRSRFREFFIMPPDAEQAIQLSRSVVKNALKAAGFGAGEPDRQVVVALAHLSAREIYLAAMAAAAKAVVAKQRALGIEHLPMELRHDRDVLGGARRALLH